MPGRQVSPDGRQQAWAGRTCHCLQAWAIGPRTEDTRVLNVRVKRFGNVVWDSSHSVAMLLTQSFFLMDFQRVCLVILNVILAICALFGFILRPFGFSLRPFQLFRFKV